jgi:phosphoribosylformylglycinamidine synthase
LLDNFCWGDPREPDRLAGLVRAAAGCHDAAVAWGAPFISGKDSLNNEYRDAAGQRVPIPGTLLISALAIVPSLEHVTTIDVKNPGNHLYLVGTTRDELGGSHLRLLDGLLGGDVPRVDLHAARDIFRGLHAAIGAGQVQACHDLSEGGLGVAAAEMLFAGSYGIELDLRQVPGAEQVQDAAVLLWSESPSRFLVEVADADAAAFEQQMQHLPVARIGRVLAEPELRIYGLEGESLVAESSRDLQAAWQSAAQSSGAAQEQRI